MASEARVYGIGLNEARRFAGMRIVAYGAVALRAGMLHFCLFDLLGFVAVAAHTERLGIGLREDDLAILRGLVAGVARAHFKRRMSKRLHQMKLPRLMGIVTLHAIGGAERLSLVRLDQVFVFGVMAIEAQRRACLGEVIVELFLAALARLVGDVTGLAAHVERCVAAALVGNIESLRVATEAEVLALVAGGGLEKLKLVVRLMRVVTLEAIANCRRMDLAFEIGGIVIGMAGETERLRRAGDQLDARDIFIYADLVATGAAGGDGGMDELALRFVLVTLGTLLGGVFLSSGTGWTPAKTNACAGEKNPPHKDPHYSGHNLPPTFTWRKCKTNAETGGVGENRQLAS